MPGNSYYAVILQHNAQSFTPLLHTLNKTGSNQTGCKD